MKTVIYLTASGTNGDSEAPSLRCRREQAVNKRAMEVFFDSNILKPLLQLSNIKRLDVDFDPVNLTDGITRNVLS